MIDVEINIPHWILILGNEARGISENIEGFINQKITIEGSGFQESLNVAVASGIILNHLNKELSDINPLINKEIYKNKLIIVSDIQDILSNQYRFH